MNTELLDRIRSIVRKEPLSFKRKFVDDCNQFYHDTYWHSTITWQQDSGRNFRVHYVQCNNGRTTAVHLVSFKPWGWFKLDKQVVHLTDGMEPIVLEALERILKEKEGQKVKKIEKALE